MSGAKVRSVPVTADSRSSIDPELTELMRLYPGYTQLFLHKILSGQEQVEKAKVQRQTNLFAGEVSKLPETSYKTTYVPKDIKPRSSKRPIRSPPVLTEAAGRVGHYETAYSSEFKPLDLNDRVVAMRKDDRSSQFPLRGNETDGPSLSAYRENYVALDLAKAHQEAVHRPRTQTKLPLRKFEGTTTHKLHYLQPPAMPPPITFGELPSFAGSAIFPSGNFEGVSVNTSAYQPHPGAVRVQADKKSPFRANLKPEGDMDLLTEHKITFKPLPLDQRLPKAAAPKSEIKLKSDDPNEYRSTSMEDFQYRRGEPAHAASAARSYINLRFDNLANYETEQRSQYRGFDTAVHPPPKPIKHDLNNLQMKSGDKFDGDTCSKLAYIPHDLVAAHNSRVAPKPGANGLLSDGLGFSSETTAKEHFRDWSPVMGKERYRHGDFTEALKALLLASESEPAAKFATRTTSKDAYIPLPLDRVHKAEPLRGNIKIEGDRDFQTAYKEAYMQPRPRLSRDDLQKLKGYLTDLRKGAVKPQAVAKATA